MRVLILLLLGLILPSARAAGPAPSPDAAGTASRPVYVIPVRDAIGSPMTYLIRRGVKNAIQSGAGLLILDMKTNGGELNATEEIVAILGEFPGPTATYVNDRAFSAGAFIAVGTDSIFMAPGGVIGAAAPVMMNPATGEGQEIPETMKKKSLSAAKALVRRTTERKGHDFEVIEAMIDSSKNLVRDGVEINPDGELLTLTAKEATKEYGTPARPLLARGIADGLEDVARRLGFTGPLVHQRATGAETLGFWLNAIRPILLIIGGLGLYWEFKTPGFGAPGIIGIVAFALYFVAAYVAGFSGWMWALLFLVGLILFGLEWFVFPGTLALGITGGALMLVSVVMALVDLYPTVPAVPGGDWNWSWGRLTVQDFNRALLTIIVTIVGFGAGVWGLSHFLPRTALYGKLVSLGASGAATEAAMAEDRSSLIGQEGVATSPLRPGGRARIGDRVIDVIAQGQMVAGGTRVRVIGFSGSEAVVAPVTDAPDSVRRA